MKMSNFETFKKLWILDPLQIISAFVKKNAFKAYSHPILYVKIISENSPLLFETFSANLIFTRPPYLLITL